MLQKYKGKQRRLPGFKVVEKIKTKKRSPQPRVKRHRAPKKFELIYRPLDLNFRGLLNHWLEELPKDFSLKKILTDNERKMIELYLFPQERGRWLNQQQVMKKVTGNPKSNLKKPIVKALMIIWSQTKFLNPSQK